MQCLINLELTVSHFPVENKWAHTGVDLISRGLLITIRGFWHAAVNRSLENN